MLASAFALGACGESELSRQQYLKGQQQARDEGCKCDPFLSSGDNRTTANTSPRWEEGYVNTCVVLRKQECQGS